MVQVSVEEYTFYSFTKHRSKVILKEYKEFYLQESLTIYDYQDLQKWFI